MPRHCRFLLLLSAHLLVAASTSAADKDGVQPLFNGRDLSGWDGMLGTKAGTKPIRARGWVVDKGVLRCMATDGAWLRTQQQFDDFVLRLEYALPRTGAAGGICVRQPPDKPLAGLALLLGAVEGKSKSKNDGLAILWDGAPPKGIDMYPAGEWNDLEIRCDGARTRISLNGVAIVDSESKDHPRSGHIGLMNDGAAKGLSFRNVRVRALKEAAAVPAADKEISTLLESIRKKHDVPAIAGGIVKSDGLVAVGIAGVRKRGDNTPATLADRFHLGSDTKALTATLIARLVDEGKLKWDATADKLFPDQAGSMPDLMKKVTLADMLAHRSGLGEVSNEGWAGFVRAGTAKDQRAAVVKKTMTLKPEGKPGETFHYSNLNYVLAAAAAERATGASWEELISHHLFGPLGMRGAGFGPMAASNRVAEPWSHRANGSPVDPDSVGDFPVVVAPAARVHCTLSDWARFVADHLKGARGEKGLLAADSYKKLHTPDHKNPPYTCGAWAANPSPDGLVLTHDGSNTLNYATAWIVPGKGFAVIAMANQGAPGGPGQRACEEARAALIRLAEKR